MFHNLDERGALDLSQGIPARALSNGVMIGGHVGGEHVLLARVDDDFFAVGGTCTHYGAPLHEGLLVGDTVRCPMHHACFSLKSGAALRAPAFDSLSLWETELRDGMIRVIGKREATNQPTQMLQTTSGAPQSVVIVGAGAAGFAAAGMLRQSGYGGRITMIGVEAELPYDRPNLSKDFLAGDIPEDWMPLRPPHFYREQEIDVITGAWVSSIDPHARRVHLERGDSVTFDRLLLATGAYPVGLDVSGADLPHVHYLRSISDTRRIVAAARAARRAVVIGASFIGLEVAAALRTRGLTVDVVGLERQPLERVLGAAMGGTVRRIHEDCGVTFHMGRTPIVIDEHMVMLDTGELLPAELVVIGVGVRPNTALAEHAGIRTDRGVLVDAHLETSIPGIFAAGDIARWPDPRTRTAIRVEHWVVAERQGQVAARNMLARSVEDRESFDAVPYFWSRHYDMSIQYVGHAESWDEEVIDGELAAHDATVTFRLGGRTLAVATVGRDRASLQAEAVMEDMRPAVVPFAVRSIHRRSMAMWRGLTMEP